MWCSAILCILAFTFVISDYLYGKGSLHFVSVVYETVFQRHREMLGTLTKIAVQNRCGCYFSRPQINCKVSVYETCWYWEESLVWLVSESFTADHKPLLGEDPAVRGFYHGVGFNSSGMMLSKLRDIGPKKGRIKLFKGRSFLCNRVLYCRSQTTTGGGSWCERLLPRLRL